MFERYKTAQKPGDRVPNPRGNARAGFRPARRRWRWKVLVLAVVGALAVYGSLERGLLRLDGAQTQGAATKFFACGNGRWVSDPARC